MAGIEKPRGLLRSLSRFFPLVESIVTYGLIVSTGATAVLGALVTYDFTKAAERHADSAAFYLWADKHVPSLFLWAFVISTALSVANAVIRKKARKLAQALATERHRTALVTENLTVLFNGLLSGAFAKVRSDDPNARITLYVHDGDGSFSQCGRHAFSPRWRARGRPTYPDNQGCVGRAWQEGWHYRVLPHQRDAYNRITEDEYQIPAEVLANLPMRSKTWAAKRLDGRNGELGVIVYESTQRDSVDEDTIRRVLDDFCASYGDLLDAFREYVPESEIARERGF